MSALKHMMIVVFLIIPGMSIASNIVAKNATTLDGIHDFTGLRNGLRDKKMTLFLCQNMR